MATRCLQTPPGRLSRPIRTLLAIDFPTVLQVSSNVGMVQAMRQVNPAKFWHWLHTLGIDATPDTDLPGAQAGQLLVIDLESGYLRRLQAMPVSRVAIVLAPMLVGAILVLAQAALVLILGLALGAGSTTGPAGVVVVLLLVGGIELTDVCTNCGALRMQHDAAGRCPRYD